MKHTFLKLILVVMMVFCVSPVVHAEDQNAINAANTYPYTEDAYVGVGGTITVNGEYKDGYQTYFTTSDPYFSISQSGSNIQVTGSSVGEGTVTQTLYRNVVDEATANDYYATDSDYLHLSHSDVKLNPNETFQITANKAASFTSDDPSVATVDANGVITGQGPGYAVITATDGEDTVSCSVQCGDDITHNTIRINVIQPSIQPITYGGVGEGNGAYVDTAYSEAKSYVYCADPNVKIDGTYVRSSKVTDTQLTIYTEGVVLHTRLILSSPKQASYENTILKKGISKKFITSGAPAFLLSQMNSTSNRYLDFKNNTVKAKKATGKITVTMNDGIDNTTEEFWSVDQKTYKIIRSAYAIARTKPHYSQKKRTQKKYVDCSTFAWRTYKKAGLTLGNKKYAPTAADDAKWLKKHALLMKGTSKNLKRMRPGDLLFFSTGGKNHRFMNINHVAVYVSNDLTIGTVGGYSSKTGCIGYRFSYDAVAIGRLHGVKYRK